MRITVKTTCIRIPRSSTAHCVEFEIADYSSSSSGPSKTEMPIVIARTSGLQGRGNELPTAASLATWLLLELEAAVADLRAEMKTSGLLDEQIKP